MSQNCFEMSRNCFGMSRNCFGMSRNCFGMSRKQWFCVYCVLLSFVVISTCTLHVEWGVCSSLKIQVLAVLSIQTVLLFPGCFSFSNLRCFVLFCEIRSGRCHETSADAIFFWSLFLWDSSRSLVIYIYRSVAFSTDSGKVFWAIFL